LATPPRGPGWTRPTRPGSASSSSIQSAPAASFDQGGELKRTFLLTAVQRNKNPALRLRALQEIVRHTDAPIYLLDEWDANLDPNNRAAADALVEQLSRRARVVEISHRDRV